MNSSQSAQILVVEDDLGDQKLIKRVFTGMELPIDLKISEKAELAWEYLQQCKDGLHKTPDLILLDLNMPGMNGKELLSIIKNDHNLKRIPLVVFTTSNSIEDIKDCYQLYASGYITKPANLEELQDVAKSICNYWFCICKRC